MFRVVCAVWLVAHLSGCTGWSRCRCDDPSGGEDATRCGEDGDRIYECLATEHTVPGGSYEDTTYTCSWESSTSCPYGCLDGECMECQPSCEGRVCGSDGCEGTCGECDGDLLCDEESGLCGTGRCAPNQELHCGDRLERLTFTESNTTNDIIFNGCNNEDSSFNGIGSEMVFSFDNDEALSVILWSNSAEYLMSALESGPEGECNVESCYTSHPGDLFVEVPADGRFFLLIETESTPSEPLDLEVECGLKHCAPALEVECGDFIEDLNLDEVETSEVQMHGCSGGASDWATWLSAKILFSFESALDQRLIVQQWPVRYGYNMYLLESDDSGACDVDRCLGPSGIYDVRAGQTYCILVEHLGFWYEDIAPLDMSVECCVPECVDRDCGDNLCGGVCGTCQADMICQSGRCTSPE